MEAGIIEKLVHVRKALQNKYQELQRHNIDDSIRREKTFEPITKPLKILVRERGYTEEASSCSTSSTPQNPFGGTTEYSKFKCSTPHINLKSIKLSKSSKIDEKGDNDNFDILEASGVSLERGDDESEIDENKMRSSNLKIVKTEDITPMTEEHYESTPTATTPTTLQRGYTTLFKERVGDVAGKYIRLLFGTNKQILDTTYGFTNLGDKGLAIGRKNIEIDNNNIYIDDKVYDGTAGVYELITLARPKEYTQQDLAIYKQILEHTKAHLTIANRLKSNCGYKYNNIIKKLFPLQSKVTKSGGSYQYWDDPNELVDRLRLIISSTAAGHTGHNNEIIDIIDELREAKIIV